jgi:hypothetical protein
MSEKLPVIKELSRAIANITEQINKTAVSTPLVPVEVQEKISEEHKKEEIKQIKKEMMEMKPKAIPEKVETAKWKMEDIIKVIKLDLSTIEYKRSPEDRYIRWDMLEDQAIPQLMEQFRDLFPKTNFKFPITLQTSMKVMCNFNEAERPPIFNGYRTDSIAKIQYIANDFEQVESIMRMQLEEVIEKTAIFPNSSDIGVEDIISYHVRFWE